MTDLARWRPCPLDCMRVGLVMMNCRCFLGRLLLLVVMRFGSCCLTLGRYLLMVLMGCHVRKIRLKVVVAVAAGCIGTGNGDHHW